MATFVSLANWTDQGVRTFKESTKRADAFARMVKKHGGTVTAIYWTIGAYDVVSVIEAPDDETVAAIALQVAALGNIRTTTMRAFTEKEFTAIVGRTG